MGRQKSSFDRIQKHLSTKGCDTPVRGAIRDDLEMIVRRCDAVRSLGDAYGQVELSPYMENLLRVSTAPAARAVAAMPAAVTV